MGVIDVCSLLGVPPCRLLDGNLYDVGIEMIDLDKLERLVKPRAGESIADAVRRRHGDIAERAVFDSFCEGVSTTPHSSLLTPHSAQPNGGAA